MAHDQLGAGQVTADIAEHLHDVVNTSRSACVRGARSGKTQHVLQFGRAARTGTGVAVGRRDLAGDGDRTVAAQRDHANTARFQRRGGRLDPRHGEQQVLEAYLGRAIGERDVEGLVGAGEQRLVDPNGA